ncbi:MAG: hypothetical protein H7Y43_11425, partial [Akkermansiaceae bacterium]|nr:hypothetical protein [Verrucomicrobiales bacterium]
ICFLALVGAHAADTSSLERSFASPPAATKPRCYWYWMDGNYTTNGITKDLEAMRRVGIGEAYIGIIADQRRLAPGNITVLTEPFWEVMTHAIREGTRLGVDIGVFNSPGWSQSGGPWVKPEQAMRHLVLPEIRLHGPQQFSGKLPRPEGDFQDVAVLAFPAPKGDADSIASLGGKVSKEPGVVRIELPQPFTARSLTVTPSKQVNVSAELQASDDGKTFRLIRKFTIDRHNLGVEVGPVPLAPVVVAFPATTARVFRLQLSGPSDIGNVQLSGAARVDGLAEKSLAKVFQEPLPPFDFYTWPQQAEPDSSDRVIASASVQNLSQNLRPDGLLEWDVPAGDWIIQRVGMVPTGTKNSPAPPEATGLEVDKMNRTALKSHFDAYVGELLARMPAAERKSWKHVVADSYERGPQNWTDGFAEKFQQRYGYDPIRYLPVLTGRMVGGAEQSNRFLWDLRRLVADSVALDYVGGLRDLCHEHGLKMWLENYGHWGFPSEFLLYGGNADEVSGEFWESGDLGSIELRDASSAAHIYGKRQVFAEAWTGGPMVLSTPWSLKRRGDWAMCQGINQFVLHVYIHQPWDDRQPGINAPFGTEFNRHNTWFELSSGWMDYLRRCSVLLQAGVQVADVAYFIGEDAPKMTGTRQPELPSGHDYDYINADVLLNRARVESSQLVLPDGMSYRVLVLPPSQTMRPQTLAKIKSFVNDGLTVLGPLPSRSPSLQGYPPCDTVVQKLAAELKGRVRTNGDIRAALHVPPDVAGINPAKILHTHRRDGDTDLYFLSNQADMPTQLTPTFRVTGKVAELWHPETGMIERLASETSEGVTRVSLPLAARGSVFVVFRPPSKGFESVASFTRNGQPVMPALPKPPVIQIKKATYGVPGDASRSRDVRSQVQALVNGGEVDFQVGELNAGGDPAFGVVKTLVVEYTADGRPFTNRAREPDSIYIGTTVLAVNRAAQLRSDKEGRLSIVASEPGKYELKMAGGKTLRAKISAVPASQEIIGAWNVSFPPKWGAPEQITLDKLTSLSESTNAGVKYFSGTATYTKTFDWKPAAKSGKQNSEIWLELGEVHDLAQEKLNGRDLGTVWQPPYRV